MTDSYDISAKNKMRQLRDKGAYDRETVHSILDAGLYASAAFVQDGQPVVVPMIYGRDGETIYLHGARKARVIRLLVYDRLPKRNVRFNRRNLYARDDARCQYCGKHFPFQELTLDHVIPRHQGGKSTWENLVCCCVRCNVRKGGRRPEQASMKLIRAPRKPRRSPVIQIKLRSKRYESWRHFISDAYWSVELAD